MVQQLKLMTVQVEQLTPAIKKFVFAAADDSALPTWEAGAHLIFELPNGLHNSYSLANDPAERGRYVTAVLREGAGHGGSAYMHDSVSVGDILKVTGPNNNFPLARDAKKHLMIAGGIGITPLLAMGYRLREMRADFHLHYCSKTPQDTAFLDEVKSVFGNNVTFHHDGGDPSKGIKLAEVLKTPEPGQHLYICGPAGLLNAARDAAKHWPEGTVHFELFSSTRTAEQIAQAQAVAADDGSFEVELAKSGLTLTIPPNRSILQVLWDNNIEVLYACEEGWCGNCKVKYLSGNVNHRDEYLSESERKDHLQVCISRAAPGEKKIVLDL
jgi:ferredoxin-NADP reductase